MTRYYSTQRPIAPGTFPRQDGKETVTNFDDKTYCEEIGREAWGYIEYSEPLTAREAEAYELVEAGVGRERNPFTQLCVWPGTMLGDASPEEFEAFFLDAIGVRVKFELEVVTNSRKELGEDGGRHDLLFYIHDDDVPKFALKRYWFGIRWWEDVMEDDSNHTTSTYPDAVWRAYPYTWL